MIESCLGREAAAQRLFRQALDTDPNFSPIWARFAASAAGLIEPSGWALRIRMMRMAQSEIHEQAAAYARRPRPRGPLDV